MLGLGLGLNRNRAIQSNAQLAKSAGAVLYLDARKATGSELPTNSPLTNPWVDLSGNNNNATPTNFAGATASGVDISNPLQPFWALDGVDDYFSLLNTSSIDITTAPLALFATIKVGESASAGFILSKNDTLGLADTQYGLVWQSSKTVYARLENVDRASTTATIITENWFNIGFIWDGSTVKLYKNLVYEGASGSYSGSLTSRQNVNIGCREGATGTRATFFKGNIGTLAIYAGVKATEANVLKSEQAISKSYIGG